MLAYFKPGLYEIFLIESGDVKSFNFWVGRKLVSIVGHNSRTLNEIYAAT